MKKNIILLLSLFAVIATSIGLSSCKDDEPPPAKPLLSFAASTMTVNEADGIIEVEVTLDKPASEDIVVGYSLKGTAKSKASVAAGEAYDYEIMSVAGKIEIAKGETTGTIELKLYSDLGIEDPETIEIKIEDVDSENIEITREDDLEVTIEQEDGMLIILNWPAPDAGNQADMDIIVRVGDNTTTWEGILTGSTQGGFESPEFIFLPHALEYAAYGISYVYYEGTLDPLEFEATFVEFIDGDFEPEGQEVTYPGTYTAANKNPWTNETIESTLVVQTFVKSGTGFSEISDISEAETGSRMRSLEHVIPPSLKKGTYQNLSLEIKNKLFKRLN